MNSDSNIPVDNNGEPIDQGRRYVLESKGVKPIKVEVSYDDSDNELFARKTSDPGVVVWKQGQQNSFVSWRRVEK